MKNKNIICVPIGGLGNQFFQYFFAYHVSLLTNRNLIVSKKSFHTYKKFDYSLNKIIRSEFLKYESIFDFILNALNLNKKKISDNLYYRIDNNVISHFQNKTKNIYVYGYWQSFKFLNNNKDIFNILSKNFSKKSFVDKWSKDNFIALHIRRGDYFKEKNVKKIHGLLSEVYYISSIEYFKKKFDNLFFYIFSDDKEYLKNLGFLKKINFKIVDLGSSDEEFVLMSYFKNFIISNSTFSLIPSFISSKRFKNINICAPKYWIRGLKTSDTDLLNFNANKIFINIK